MKGPCIAYDESGMEVAWMLVDKSGRCVPFNDEGALLVVSEIQAMREPSTAPKGATEP
jgi:hypothetical protein